MSEATLWMPPVRPTDEAPTLPSDSTAARALRTAVDPRVLSAEILGLLLLAVAFRHPITTALGTAGPDTPPVIASDGAAAHPAAKPQAAPAATGGARVGAVPLHAPRDPFAPLEGSTSLAAAAAATAAQSTGVPAPTSTAAASSSSAPSSSTYRVRSGDSLWSIARQNIGPSATTASIDATWHQIYDANSAVIGGNPSVVHVGIVLRIPATHG